MGSVGCLLDFELHMVVSCVRNDVLYTLAGGVSAIFAQLTSSADPFETIPNRSFSICFMCSAEGFEIDISWPHSTSVYF